jgi:putative copper export protein
MTASVYTMRRRHPRRDRPRDRRLRRIALIVAGIAAAWSIALFVSGGFSVRIAGMRIATHDPYRPLLLTAAALTVFVISLGATRAYVAVTRVTGPVTYTHLTLPTILLV